MKILDLIQTPHCSDLVDAVIINGKKIKLDEISESSESSETLSNFDFKIQLTPDAICLNIEGDKAAKILDIIRAEQIKALVISTDPVESARLKSFVILKKGKISPYTGYLAIGVYASITGSETPIAIAPDLDFDLDNDFSIVSKISKFENYDIAPIWMMRIKAGAKDADGLKIADLCNLRNKIGDPIDPVGVMAAHAQRLANQLPTKSEIPSILDIVNRFVARSFLSDIEMSEVLESIEEPSIGGDDGNNSTAMTELEASFFDLDSKGRPNRSAFRHDLMGIYIIEKYHVKLLPIEGSSTGGSDLILHYYVNDPDDDKYGLYSSDTLKIERIISSLCPRLTDRQRKEVLRWIEVNAPIYKSVGDKSTVAFKNGLYNILSDEFTQFSPETIKLFKLSCNFNPEAKSPKIIDFFKRFSDGDSKITEFALQQIGYVFLDCPNFIKKSIPYFISPPNCGKSSFFSLIRTLYPSQISFIDPQLFDRDIFAGAEIIGKRALICDDIPVGSGSGYLGGQAVSLLKKIASGDQISARLMRRGYTSFVPTSRLFISANDLIKVGGDSGLGLMARIIPVRLTHDFSRDSDLDPNFIENLEPEDIEFLAYVAVLSLKVLLETKRFTEPDSSSAIAQTMSQDADIVTSYLSETYGDDPDGSKLVGLPSIVCYEDFVKYCKDSGYGLDADGRAKTIPHINSFVKKIKVKYRLKLGPQERITDENGHSKVVKRFIAEI